MKLELLPPEKPTDKKVADLDDALLRLLVRAVLDQRETFIRKIRARVTYFVDNRLHISLRLSFFGWDQDYGLEMEILKDMAQMAMDPTEFIGCRITDTLRDLGIMIRKDLAEGRHK